VRLDDSAEGRIARLDASLARRGQDITVRRLTLGPGGLQIPFDAEGVRARVRAAADDELIANIAQQQWIVILSPTGLSAFPLPLRKGDKAVIDGAAKNVELVKPFLVDGTLVRIELTVFG